MNAPTKEERDALRALCAEPDDEHACKRCGDSYALREGCDPTPLCDPCAHAVIEEDVPRLLDALDAAAAIRGEPEEPLAYMPIDRLSTEALADGIQALVMGALWTAQHAGARPIGIEVRVVTQSDTEAGR